MGWSKESVVFAIDLGGVQSCLNELANCGIHVGSDGAIWQSMAPPNPFNNDTLLWGRAIKIFGKLSSVLEERAGLHLRADYGIDNHNGKRQLAKLNSCTGKASGKWLQAFLSFWWPKMIDDIFIMATGHNHATNFVKALNDTHAYLITMCSPGIALPQR